MFKVLWLMKRKDGTSMQNLIDYYEKNHSLLAADLFKKNGFKPAKYVRKYLHPLADPIPEGPSQHDDDYDVAMEMWFNSREEFDQMITFSSPPEVQDAITADERNFLDRHKRAVFILEEHETLF